MEKKTICNNINNRLIVGSLFSERLLCSNAEAFALKFNIITIIIQLNNASAF